MSTPSPTGSEDEPRPRKRPILLWSAFGIFVLGSLAAWVATERISADYLAEIEAIRSDGDPAEASEFEPLSGEPDPAAELFRLAFARTVDWFETEPSTEAEWEQELPELRELLAKNAEALELAHRAAAHPSGRFPLDLRRGLEVDLMHLSKLRELGELLALESEVARRDGRPGEAWDAVAAIFGCARVLDEEPLLVSRFVRISILLQACGRLQRLLDAGLPAGVDPSGVRDAIEAALRVRGQRRVMIVERCLIIEDLKLLADAGQDSYSGNRYPGPLIPLLRPVVRSQAVSTLRILRELVELADRPYWEIATRIRRLDDELESADWLERGGYFTYDDYFRREATVRTRLETARAAIAWHEGGWVAGEDGRLVPPWPVIDHGTGLPMTIRREEGRVVLAPDATIADQDLAPEWPLPE